MGDIKKYHRAAISQCQRTGMGQNFMVAKFWLRRAIAPYSLLGAAIATLTFGVGACQAEEVETLTTTPAHFLWQIESPNNTVYLLGSLHFLNDEQYPLPTAMQEAFAEAEVVVFETDIGTEASLETATIMLDKAQPEPGEALVEVLSDETYALAAETAEEMGVAMAFFESFEPWFYALSITSLQLISLGFEPKYGIDQHFYERSQTAEKPMLFLETLEEQIDFFEQLSVDEQRQFTEQTLEELDLVEASFDEMVTAWATGDRAALSEILLASFEDYPEMQQIFLTNRNQNWVPQIATFLQDDDDYLVIVGALHLVGPDNVIELLEQQGYTAEQL